MNTGNIKYMTEFCNHATPNVSPSSSNPAPIVCLVYRVSIMIPAPNKNTPVHTQGPPANTPNKVASINSGAMKYRTLIRNFLNIMYSRPNGLCATNIK